MYIWEVECEVEWDYHEDGDYLDSEGYSIVAEDYQELIKKLRKLVLAKSRNFKDDEPDENGKFVTHKPIAIRDITKLERKAHIYA